MQENPENKQKSIQVNLKMPENVNNKLLTGEYQRVGGVIRDAANKRIVHLLRETSISPNEPNNLTLPSLSMFGNVASVLNLGATVAFGIGTFQKLGRVEASLYEANQSLGRTETKIDHLNDKTSDILEKTVNFGMATLHKLGRVESSLYDANQSLGRTETKIDHLHDKTSDILDKTINFGMATLQKLGGIESKIDKASQVLWRVDSKVDKANRTLGRVESRVGVINNKSNIAIEKLGELGQRAEKLQWTVELSFIQTLQTLENIKEFQEIELVGDLDSAANMAWTCQFLAPDSPQRMTRIENAFHTVSKVKAKLLLHTENEMQAAIEWMQKKRSSNFDFSIDDSVITALYRLRQTVVACALSASISAEADDLQAASSNLAKEQKRLFTLLYQLASLALSSDARSYQTLLSEAYQNVMPSSRLNSWINRFDTHLSGLEDMIELLRINGFSSQKSTMPAEIQRVFDYSDRLEKEYSRLQKLHRKTLLANKDLSELNSMEMTEEKLEKIRSELDDLRPDKISLFSELADNFRNITSNKINANTDIFFDLIDGLYEDLQRLKGYELEYQTAANLNMSIHEYREFLRIDEIPENENLVFFTVEEQVIT
ncbi:MAG: hypothetical protein Q8N30_15635 [Methylococcales bacterium]|nr:hypothetical protein [Methylococcales bacterium]